MITRNPYLRSSPSGVQDPVVLRRIRLTARFVGAVRAPGFVQRALRRRLQNAQVADFLAFSESRGASEVGFPEARSWLVTRALPLLTAPTRRQVLLVRVVWGVLGLLAVLPFAVSAVAS